MSSKKRPVRSLSVSLLLGILLGIFENFIEALQQRILGSLVRCIAGLLSLCVWSAPLVKADGLKSADGTIKLLVRTPADTVSDFQGLPRQLSGLPSVSVEYKLIWRLTLQLLSQQLHETSKAGALQSGVSSDGQIVAGQPASGRQSRGPHDNLEWGYLHLLISGLVSFWVGFLAGFFWPNIPQSATPGGQSPAQPYNPSPGVAL